MGGKSLCSDKKKNQKNTQMCYSFPTFPSDFLKITLVDFSKKEESGVKGNHRGEGGSESLSTGHLLLVRY